MKGNLEELKAKKDRLMEEENEAAKALRAISARRIAADIAYLECKLGVRPGDIVRFRGKDFMVSGIDHRGWVSGYRSTKSGWHKCETCIYNEWQHKDRA